MSDAERRRLIDAEEGKAPWKKWGPYLSERAWGTVREDYSDHGTAWEHFPHDDARSKAYRWGEDGLAGISDENQILCFSVAVWNGNDPILKERLFGLTGNEGNHGEDVKECYYYLDSSPTHSYMKYLYKYPQSPYPYEAIVSANRQRGRNEHEYELLDTGVFDEDRYFDITTEYAKATPEDIFIFITAENRGPDAAELVILPTFWFRNTWSWSDSGDRPQIKSTSKTLCQANSAWLGSMWLLADKPDEWIFTENETDYQATHGLTGGAYKKNAFHKYIVNGDESAINPGKTGSKAAAVYRLNLDGGSSAVIRLRMSAKKPRDAFKHAAGTIEARKTETEEFYNSLTCGRADADLTGIQRQALAGLLWSKQFFYYDVDEWLKGDPAMPKPPESRNQGRNHNWRHLNNADIISMPDKWEYPWYATWDLAFHCVSFAKIDPRFAKDQLILMCREWYMHPNGQFPAYEWAFNDVNPPVHAWAALAVYRIEKNSWGRSDTEFLEKIFQKLLLNFTWWVNRKDADGNNLFEGGFLGLDNIGIFDRSAKLPTGGHLEQSDGTSWMAMYCLNMLSISLELAQTSRAYEDMATKFFEHFMYIASAMNNIGGEGVSLWDEEDGFYYDVLHVHGQKPYHLKIRSMVGLIPLFAVCIMDDEQLDKTPDFKRRMEWFLANRPDLCGNVACMKTPGVEGRKMLAIANQERLPLIMSKLLDESEFLSDYGIRSISKFHKANPFKMRLNGAEFGVGYEPAESTTGMFGGNSNWRGPIWFPLNYLIIESLQQYHQYFGDTLKVECPSGSGKYLTLDEAAQELSRRLASIFTKDSAGRRPVFGGTEKFQSDPHFKDHLLFYEYFNGDNGAGVGASHQTGWTALISNLIDNCSES